MKFPRILPGLRVRVLAMLLVSVITTDTFTLAMAGPQPVQFDQLTNSEKKDPVEQQTIWVSPPACTTLCPFPDDRSQWVTNPTSCWWDADDHRSVYATNDYLDSNASVQVSDCQIAEADYTYETRYGTTGWWTNPPRPLGMQINAPSPNLTVTACYQP